MLEVKITLDRENKTRSFVFIVYNILSWQKNQLAILLMNKK